MFIELIKVMRPKQWYKNTVVFAALFFSKNFFNLAMLETVVLGFVALCFLSSSSYIINDIIDAKQDRSHDKKKNRPIASGKLPISLAIVWMVILLIVGVYISFTVGEKFTVLMAVFVIFLQSYNFYFKNIAFADISILSTNFMIRAVAGAIAINVIISPWLMLGTYLLALFLSSAKRKVDLETLGENAKKYKKVFEIYTIGLLDRILIVSSTLVFVAYCLYSFLGSLGNPTIMIATIPIVFFLIFRYYYLAISKNQIARDPENVFTDKQMLAGMILWIVILVTGLYLPIDNWSYLP